MLEEPQEPLYRQGGTALIVIVDVHDCPDPFSGVLADD